MFHLVTHAFFKALLFLGAGSVMHAMGGRDRHPPVRRPAASDAHHPLDVPVRLPGSGRACSPSPASGARTPILGGCLATGAGGGIGLYHVLYLAAIATALLTAFYTFRAFFLTFYGPERIPPEAGHHAHESPRGDDLAAGDPGLRPLAVGACFECTGRLLPIFAQTPSLAYSGVAGRSGGAGGRHLERGPYQHGRWPAAGIGWRQCCIWARRGCAAAGPADGSVFGLYRLSRESSSSIRFITC